MKVKSFWDNNPHTPESFDAEVVTIPDQSLSVRDIIYRFTRGQMELSPIESGDDEDIDDDSYFEDEFDAMDSVSSGQSLYDDFKSRFTDSSPRDDSSSRDDSSPRDDSSSRDDSSPRYDSPSPL